MAEIRVRYREDMGEYGNYGVGIWDFVRMSSVSQLSFDADGDTRLCCFSVPITIRYLCQKENGIEAWTETDRTLQ
jgi:hypothetical protein